jgi:hypothetical protein
VKVTARSERNQFADFEEAIAVPAHNPHTPAAAFRFERQLVATGLYQPPEGLAGAAGWLVDDDTAMPLVPLAGARVRVALRHSGNQNFASGYRAVTDANGAFVAVMNDLGDIQPDLATPAQGGGLLGWLSVRRGAVTRFTGLLPVRPGRVTRFAEPFSWAALNPAPPP